MKRPYLLKSEFFPSREEWLKSGSEKEVAVLMSGGVDSSVAAFLLLEEGWKVLGVTMKILDYRKNGMKSCCSSDADHVCQRLGIPHYTIDVRRYFNEYVIEPFKRSYLEGSTPNPCFFCNTRIKFDLVWQEIRAGTGIAYLATGHYARLIGHGRARRLARASNPARDQSYFLYGISRSNLAKLILPIGELGKERVREIARQNNLPVADREDSMEICFTGQKDYRRAFFSELGSDSGPILNTAGEIIGKHGGIFNYTIGQRRGLRVAAGKPMYVIRICAQCNSVTLGTYDEVITRYVEADSLNVLVPGILRPGAELFGKIRSAGDPSACVLTMVSEGRITVKFEEPQFAPTRGQHLVLYDRNGNLVGGGTIDMSSNRGHECISIKSNTEQ